jgi:AmmeMemoRadiSam system protein B
MKKTIAFILLNFVVFLAGENVRPIRDDIGFCWQKEQVNRLMDYLEKNETEELDLPGLVAGIAPHDDYLYAGRVDYPLFSRIKTREVVVFGVTHRTVRLRIDDPQNKVIFDSYPFWTGPFKQVGISPLREYLKEKLDKEYYMVSNEAHRLEHSIEAMIPFLQYFNRNIKITPIMVTGMDFETMDRFSDKLSTLIAAYVRENNLEPGKDIFFLISADANHYGKDFDNIVFGEDARAHELAVKHDKKIAETCLAGDITKKKIYQLTRQLWGKTYKDYKDTVWCGKFSIPFGMLTVLKTIEKVKNGTGIKGRLLRYSDTYTEGVLPLKKPGYGITAPFSLKHWVGFLSAAFVLDN